jgi:hypothetical protein
MTQKQAAIMRVEHTIEQLKGICAHLCLQFYTFGFDMMRLQLKCDLDRLGRYYKALMRLHLVK